MSSDSSILSVKAKLVAELRAQLQRLERARQTTNQGIFSTGCEPLDRLLPRRGLSRGTLIEWLAMGEASGAMWLALIAAREACQEDGPLVVIDGRGTFYPPAATAAGVDLERLIVVRPSSAREETWALDQSLRSEGAGTVLCMTDRLGQRALRRLQLAAEASGGVGLLVRPASVRHEPCWSEARLLVEPRAGTTGRRLSVEVLRTRGTVADELIAERKLELEIDDETGVMRAIARLASAATRRRSSGA